MILLLEIPVKKSVIQVMEDSQALRDVETVVDLYNMKYHGCVIQKMLHRVVKGCGNLNGGIHERKGI